MLHIARSRLHRLPFTRQELSLVAVTAVWGSTFVVIAKVMQYSGPLFFIGIRFLAAAAIAAVVFHRSLARITRTDLIAGVSIGVTMTFGYGLQTYGLQTLDASTSAFITAMYVPLVPLLLWAVFRRTPKAMTIAGVGLAFTGLILLAGPSAAGISLGAGEIATLLGAVAMAAEIILIGSFAGKADLGRVTIIQLFVAGAVALLVMPVVGESVPSFSWWWLGAALGMGAASCLIQATMNWAQRTVSPTRATIIYTGEPVWGAVFGRLAGDRLGPLALVGAVLILAGVLVSELKPKQPADAEIEGELAQAGTR
ncbi:DMT family transporter [Gordonia sp. TBRC 11910]|uniref:DMT family transporter n=1 Tax=Gordonia asplenii TaxID=2725283 RepID=A0A848KYY0_9ACTN|nr:DMT family transporter [Gordonia asplenii]NMO03796.1 DMT family transporter [Gordonia asplenii]